MVFFSALLLSLLITLSLVPLFRNQAIRLNAVDVPNERKVHTRPIPRIGGAAMALGVLVPVLLWMPDTRLLLPLVAGAGLVAGFGFLDDLRELGSGAKFGAQVVAALIVIVWGGVQIRSLGSLLPEGVMLPPLLGIPLTLVAIVGVTNAINLADGLDGLAGGISLLSFMVLAWLGFESGRPEVALVAACVCGSIFGFLRFNTHPASIFMGDAGSQLLGFLSVVLALTVSQQAPYSPYFPLLLLGFPIFDTVRVMVERMRRGLPPFRADRNHFHHKLLARGFCHPEAVTLIYLIHASLTLAAGLFRFGSDGVLLAGYGGFATITLLLLRGPVAGAPSFARFRRLEEPLRAVWRRCRVSGLPVRWSFAGLKVLMGLVGLLLVVVPAETSPWFAWFALATGALTLVGLAVPESMRGWLLRAAIYLVSPYLIYFGQFRSETLAAPAMLLHLADACYPAIGLLATLVIKLTRRTGYRSTPLDLLILFIVLALPLWTGSVQDKTLLLIVAAKILVLFFSFEVLLVELRHRYRKLQLSVGLLLLIAAGRLFLQTLF